MVMPKGGRGHKAPYTTCIVRIPEDIRHLVEALSEQYRISVVEQTEFTASGLPSLEEALIEAKKILAQKRSAKESIIKLLQVLYNTKLSKSDLD